MRKTGEKLLSILSNDKSCIVLLHNTDSLEKANAIVKGGFRFENQLTYSTDRINPSDPVEINYFLVERKEYGDFTIIIEISREIFKQYSSLAENSNLNFEEILNVEEPFLSENDEYVFTLSQYYIKGIFNNKTGETYLNPVFDPSFDSPEYLANFKKLNDEVH